MQCPRCQFENREGAKFCVECGTKLEINCSKCSHLNPPTSKFCEECGSQLNLLPKQAPQELSFDEKIAKIQKYLPKGVIEKILAQKDRIEGERKQVTVMFCDLEGYTSLSDRLGPEEAYKVMDEIYEILIHKVHDYEGTVNEMTGDGIMALFGAPIALEDAPQRAIRSALKIHREMTKLSEKIKQKREGMPSLKMRIGIHTGPVVVGTMGNDLRLEFKAVGDTVNLASRMEGLAEPGTIYVTEDTFRLSEGFFRFEALGEKQVKGKDKPLRIYRVIAPSTRRTRFEVSSEQGLTPLVARGRELELLLDGFEQVKAGAGKAFSISAGAGVGKSRVLYEFRKAVGHEDVIFLEGKCLSYGRGMAYQPIIDVLKSNFDIAETEEDSQIGEKVVRGLKILGLDEASTLPYVLELLSVKDSGIEKIPISPEAMKDQIIQTIQKIVLKGADLRPHIIAVEDLHWIDDSSEDVLKYLLGSIPGARVLLIFTYRLEFLPTWAGKSYHTQLTLNHLSERESHTMVSHILGSDEFASDLEALILERTEGIPLFIEEFVKALKYLNIMEIKDNTYHLVKDIQTLAVPSTIQEIIMSRVDALPEGARKVLQTGSVIEREFSYELIRRVTGLLERELLSYLATLKDSELLYERGIFPESNYIFKHALTRDVVYDSILTSRKTRLHLQIGLAIEELYEQNIDAHYAALVEHFANAADYEKAAEYARLAAQKAEKMASLNDAIDYTEKGVACLERLPNTDEVLKQIIDARTTLGLYWLQLFHYPEAKAAINPIVDTALQSENKRRLPQLFVLLGTYEYCFKEDISKAFNLLDEALKAAGKEKDIASMGFVHWRLGLALSFNCEFEKACYNFEKALKINAAANNLWAVSRAKNYISWSGYFYGGRIGLAYQTSKEGIQLAEESGDIYSKAMASVAHGISCYGKGLLEESKKYLLRGVDLCETISLSMWDGLAHIYLGESYFDMGEYRNSKHQYKKAVPLFRNKGFPSFKGLTEIGVAMAKVMMDEKDVSLQSLYDHVYENKLQICESWKLIYISTVLLNMDNHHIKDSEDCIKRAIKSAERNNMMWYLAKGYTLYAELFKRKGEQLKSRKNLNKAIEIMKECGADGWVEKYEKELAKL
jgi:class 3 adenylate cyclase/tetratricopeptide (TPR) repeat protein